MDRHAFPYDPKYEWKAVTLLSLSFGLVNVDRFIITPLFPTIARDLNLTYTDLGIVTGALAVAWGTAALFMGNISDRIGHRKVIIGSIILFSLLVGVSGLATGLAALVCVRILMGLADGAFTPVSISATIAASKESRHGFNLGLQQMMAPLLGMAATPLLVTQLLHYIDWRWIFLLLAVPGILLAVILSFVLRECSHVGAVEVQAPGQAVEEGGGSLWANWRGVLRHRNPPILILCMLCWMASVAINATLMPGYLMNVRSFTLSEMGVLLSAFGFGGAIGSVALPALSDRLGRKPVIVLGALAACLSLLVMLQWASTIAAVFGCLFFMAFFHLACIALTVGPISAESVPVGLMATSSGLIIGLGEIFGGGVAPVIAGASVERFGLYAVLHAGAATLFIGGCAALFLKETTPRLAQ